MLRAAIVFLCSVLAIAAWADIYRWTDENGQVHFGERPAGQNATRIDVPETRSGSSEVPVEAERRDRQRRMLEAFEYERGRKAEQAAREADERRRKEAACSRYRAYWRRLSHPGPIYFAEPDGNRRYLDDAQRAAEKDRLRPFYQQACGNRPE